jgi:hypothetical protein
MLSKLTLDQLHQELAKTTSSLLTYTRHQIRIEILLRKKAVA